MEMDNPNLREFVESARKIDGVKAVILYGSTTDAVKSQDSSSDIDLFICMDSDTFRTELHHYEDIARITRGRIKPAIKSVQEFNKDNYVTLTRRAIQHLDNVAEVLYESDGLDIRKEIYYLWNQTAQDKCKIENAYMTAPSLIIRHRLFELCRGVTTKVMNDKRTHFDPPSKSFWQSASDIFATDISTDDERHIIPIVSECYIDGSIPGPWRDTDLTPAEYQGYMYRTIRDDITRLNDELKKKKLSPKMIETAKQAYCDHKSLVEDNMWLLNRYLNETIR